MNKDENRAFILKTESLVNPKDVTAISFLGDFNRMFPRSIQEKNMQRGSEQVPYMGFIVEPYCFFLTYRITNLEAAKALLPAGYELAEARVFKDQEPCPLLILGAFSLRTSAFTGNRLECYVIARKKDTGIMSWIIADYETNTNTYDPKNCFGGYSSDPAILTTSPHGGLIAEFRGKTSKKHFSLTADLEKGVWRDLDQELWVDGNLSIDYGGALMMPDSKPFSLIFDPLLMARAKEIPSGSYQVLGNTWTEGLADSLEPLCAAVFPYTQHFVIKQHPSEKPLAGEAEMTAQARQFIETSGFRIMSGDDIKKPLLASLAVSALITWGALVFFVIQYFSR